MNTDSKVKNDASAFTYKLMSHTYRASLTIEAALSLSFFILACVVLMVPMLILNQHQNSSYTLEENSRLLSKTKYIEYYQSSITDIKFAPDVLNGAESALSSFILQEQVIQPGMDNTDLFTESKIDSQSIKYILNYDAIMPFSILGLSSLPQQVVSYRRAWIGASGYRWGENSGGAEGENDPTVYISSIDKTNNVYHTTMGCTYLSHIFVETSGSAIQGQPTKWPGVKFIPCAVCQPNSTTPVVYYTSGGKNYHRSKTCTTLKSYIQPVPLSRALESGRHACVRCG